MNATRKEDNISVVTSKLFGLILKMPLEERRRLLTEVERNHQNQAQHSYIRRKYERQDHLIDIDYSVNDQFFKGFALNSSAGGIFIESSKSALPKLSPGEPVVLSFDHPRKQEHMKLSGKIARVNKAGIGVMFDQTVPDWWTA